MAHDVTPFPLSVEVRITSHEQLPLYQSQHEKRREEDAPSPLPVERRGRTQTCDSDKAADYQGSKHLKRVA